MTTAAEQIDRFLRDNPVGRLYIVVGFASPFGLRWLADRSEGRGVRLLIGDIRTGFSRPSESDRVAAIRFIGRDDVQVVNWYRKRGGHRMAHAKTWMIKSGSGAEAACEFLVGSANLTRKGLFQNVEMMTRPHPDEHDRLHDDMLRIMYKSWPIEDKLLHKLNATTAATRSIVADSQTGFNAAHASAHRTPTLKRSHTDTQPTDRASLTRPQHQQPTFESYSRKRELARSAGLVLAGLSLLSLFLFGLFWIWKAAYTGWLDMVGL